ncbi:hypothetical protein D3C80_1280320 [compost metagenome]
MPQGLDTGDHFNTEHIGIVITGTKLLFGVAAAHISEIRQAFNFISVLGIEHKTVEPHQGHVTDELLNRVHTQHPVAGYVEHRAVVIESWLFIYREGFLGTCVFHKQAKSAVKMYLFLILNKPSVAVSSHLQRPICLNNLNRYCVFRLRFYAQHSAKLCHTTQHVLR